MTISRAIELAMAEVLRAFTNIGESAVIRAWQSLTDEQAIALTGEKQLPMVDVRCSPPATDDQVTRYCDVQVICGTHIDDDKNHAQYEDGAVNLIAVNMRVHYSTPIT